MVNFNKISTRYGAMFSGIAVLFIISAVLNISLIADIKERLEGFSRAFNPAISAVLNGDRDLYQARVAELKVLTVPTASKQATEFYNDYAENAQQAFDRMNKYKRLMAEYPELQEKVSSFEQSFNRWKSSSSKVFELVNNNQLAEAQRLSDGMAKEDFSALRDYYDIAGEAADKKSLLLSKMTIDYVESMQSILLIISLLVVFFILFAGIAGPRAMSKALLGLSDKLQAISKGDGDLSKRIDSLRKDEIGQVARDFDEFLDGLTLLLKSIVDNAEQVVDGVGNLNDGVKQIDESSAVQLQSVDMVVTAVNEMSYAIKEVAKNAQLTSTELNDVQQLTDSGTQVTIDSVGQIKGVSETVEQAAQVIAKLSENSADISSVIDVIRGIADQTNLLALNAAIEAARAGEQGRGFAVVADEVRSLASKTQQSTESIQKMIEELQHGVSEAVEAIGKGNRATQSSVELSQQTLDALSKISEAAERVADVAAQSATATEQQTQVVGEISENLSDMSNQSKLSNEIAKKNGLLGDDTKSLAVALRHSVSRFKF